MNTCELVKPLTPAETSIITRLRAAFPDKLSLGGSRALELYFNRDFQSADLDIFYYGNRPMETWAVMNFLESIGFEVLSKNTSEFKEYKITGQFGLYKLKCKESGIHVDLVMVRDEGKDSSFGSTLAAIQYEITYSRVPLCIDIPAWAKSDLFNMRVNVRVCQNTSTQVSKVVERAIELGFEVSLVNY